MYNVADQYVQELSDAAGGRLYPAQTTQNLSADFSQIAAELSQQYTLCYYPMSQKKDDSFHRIRVDVDRPGVKIRARPGYRAAQVITSAK
jgi:VWFA-related protein